MSGFFDAIKQLTVATQSHMLFVLSLIGLIWLVNFINWWLLGSRLNMLGIYPRRLFGLIGIPFAPILHGHFNHLFFNSFPLFVMAIMILLKGYSAFYYVTGIIVVISGVLTWLVGRPAFHLGASSVIMGYWSFLLIQAYYDRTAMALILGAITLYYFGGLLMSLFPDEKEVSWEGHVSGAIAGVCAYFALPFV